MSEFRTKLARLLIVGSGDVALRALPWLLKRFRVYALCRSAEAAERWRSAGAIPVRGDLDQPASLKRLSGLAEYVLHTAPPATDRAGDPRSERLLARIGSARMIPRAVVYISTTGVYGDCAGARVAETRTPRPVNARAKRRVLAEQGLRRWLRQGAGNGAGGRTSRLAVLRAPGIYAADRLPLARLQSGTPALVREEDGYTSHIHADDLAMAACLALFRIRGGRILHVCDQSELRMGDWFDQVAAAFELAAPRRISREEAERTLPESLLSFMRESRRLEHRRLAEELRLRLRYRTVEEGLAAAVERHRMLPVATDADRGRRQQDHEAGQVGQQTRP